MFYALMLASATITAFSQIILKKSANKKHKGIIFEYINPYVLFSYVCYFGVLVLNVFIYTKIDYRFGVVINSMASVLVMVFSKLMLKETITRRRIWGNVLIILGIVIFSLLWLYYKQCLCYNNKFGRRNFYEKEFKFSIMYMYASCCF